MELKPEIKPSTYRFVKSVLDSNTSITLKEYSEMFKRHKESRKEKNGAFRDVSKLLKSLIQHEIKKLSVNGPITGVEWAGGVLVVKLSGILFLLPINYSVYPIRFLMAYFGGKISGEKLKRKEDESLLKFVKRFVDHFSTTPETVAGFARLYKLIGVLTLHRDLYKKRKVLGN
jgi:hypothetical protein